MLFIDNFVFIKLLSLLLPIQYWEANGAICSVVILGSWLGGSVTVRSGVCSFRVRFGREVVIGTFLWLRRLRVQLALYVDGGRGHVVVMRQRVTLKALGAFAKPGEIGVASLKH